MEAYKREFIQFLEQAGVLKFGDITAKSGRKIPYFINAGMIKTGEEIAKLGEFYDPYHPALLALMAHIAKAANEAGIWAGICGELGADISLLPTFLAIGVDELSVTPSAVLPLRAEIRKSIAQTCTLEMLNG